MTSHLFPNQRCVGGGEGGAIYAAEQDGKFYAFTDESASMDMLSEEDAADLADDLANSAPAEFNSAEARDRYLIERYGAFLGRGVELWPAESRKSVAGMLLRAVTFAADKHRHQRRKDADASPYINHPIALANVLANEGGVDDVVVLCAAILHDTIEDTETTAADIEILFGAKVSSIVLEVTDDKSLPKEVRKQLQIDHAPHLSPEAKLVKLADKISNLRDILASPPADWTIQRKQEYFDWAAAVVSGVRGIHPQLESVFDALYARRAELH